MEDDTFELETPADFDDAEVFEEEDAEDAEDIPESQHEAMPDAVRKFIVLFHKQLLQKDVEKITVIYHFSFSKLTDRFFRESAWPSEETVAPLVNNDKTFLLLYKELCFRHLYSKREEPSLELRFGSWNNYCQLFDSICKTSGELELPLQWLWDMIDEFIFQFQLNHAKLALFQDNPDVWSVTSVIINLEKLVAEGKITDLLEAQKADCQPQQQFTLVQALGYFALVGLSRVHCLLGDYHSTLTALELFDLTRRGLYTRVTACHVSLNYNLAFAYLMTRRYASAVHVVGSTLTHITRTKQYHTRSYQYDQMMKKNEKLYYLLALAGALAPQGIGPLGSELVEQALHEKCGDKILRINRGEFAAYEDMFYKASPKFINPCPPQLEAAGQSDAESDEASSGPNDHNHEQLKLQVRVFMQEVEEQATLGTLRSFLRLYTTISISKLASFLDTDEATVRAQLMCYKHKTVHMPHLGPRLPESATPLDVTFHITGDMVHVVDAKQARRYTDYFLRHIHKFDSLNSRLIAQ
jgi:translation initiation factor 3 subunit L